MNILKDAQLFFGCKIDSKLREALAQAKPGDRRYFEDAASDFLCIIEVGEEKWLGKMVKGGVAVTEVEDMQRNVMSIIRRIAPEIRKAASTIKIFATVEDTVIGGRIDRIDRIEDGDSKPASSGPYIANY